MRYKTKVTEHVVEHEVTTRTTCDACGRELASEGGIFTRNEVTIEAQIGDVFPEGDSRVIYETDICGACFTDKVLPALAAIGIAARMRDADNHKDDGRVMDWPPKEQAR